MEPGIPITKAQTKSGKTVFIRSLSHDDTDVLLSYANDLIDEDTFVLLSGDHLTLEYEEDYVTKAVGDCRVGKKIHLLAFIEGELASSFEVRRYSLRKSHVGEVGISVTKKFRGDGVGKLCLSALIQEAEKLGLRLLVLTCFASNTAAINLYKSVGFMISGTTPGMLLYKGVFEGEVHMYKPLGKDSHS